MEFGGIAIVAGFVAAFSAVSARLDRWAITAPMVFTAFGLLVGPEALDVVPLELDTSFVRVLAEFTLVLVLFTDAARIDLRALRGQHAIPSRLLGIGLPLCIACGAGTAMLVFADVSWTEATLIGAVLAPTDAALGQIVVTSRSVPVRIRQALNVESGLNDGIVLPVVTIFLAVAIGDAINPARFVARQIGFGVGVGVGILVGAVGGLLIRRASAREFMSPSFQQIGTLAVALAAFSSAEFLDGNGFIGAFVGGATFGFVARDVCHGVYRFTEEEGQLLTLLVFMIFGGAILGPALGEIDARTFVYAALSLTAIRMVPAAVSLTGLHLHWRTVAFLAWFGPRGLASVLFGIVIVEESGLAFSNDVLVVVACTVAASILAHGISARPAAMAYGQRMADMGQPGMPEMAAVDDQRVRVPFRGDSSS